MFKKNKGITLIALIITIVVMLILVAVSIQLVINSGLFETAKNAKIATEEAYRNETTLGNKVNINGKEYNSVEEYVAEENGESGGGNTLPSIVAGKKATSKSTYTSNGKTAIIPAGFTVSGVPSEASIDGGLVIYLIDKKENGTAWTDEEIAAIDWTNGTTVANLQKTYDQFVWIPIARENINDMYMCQSEDGTKSCRITVENGKAKCTTHNSNQMAGRLYATSIGEDFTSSLTTQTYTSNSGLREPDIVTNYDNSTTYLGYLNGIIGTSFAPTTDTTNNKGTANTDLKTYLQEEYNETVKSVYENQGFYCRKI